MKITICACSSRSFIDKDKVARLAALACKAGVEVELVADLCELCQAKEKQVHSIAQTTVVACYNRAVKALMAYVGESDVESLDLRGGSMESVCQSLGISDAELADEDIREWKAQIDAMPVKQGKDAWYPTIDKSRCAECEKCLQFCPFGVYELVEGRVAVVNPTHCKNNCPACARTCPAGAIIFPKCDQSPINGGEAERADSEGKSLKELYGEALREKLKARSSILTNSKQ